MAGISFSASTSNSYRVVRRGSWEDAPKVDPAESNRVSALPRVPIQPRKEGGRCYIVSIQRLEGGSRTWSRAALTHARRVIDAGDVTKFGGWPGPAAGARRR